MVQTKFRYSRQLFGSYDHFWQPYQNNNAKMDVLEMETADVLSRLADKILGPGINIRKLYS